MATSFKSTLKIVVLLFLVLGFNGSHSLASGLAVADPSVPAFEQLAPSGEENRYIPNAPQTAVGYGRFFAFLHDYLGLIREQDQARHDQLLTILICAEKMHSAIVAAFSRGCFEKDYELAIKFRNIFMGQTFDMDIQPRHLRKLKRRIGKFDDFFQHYRFNKKHSLSLDERQVFEKVITLNSLMTDIILSDRFFDFGVGSKTVDTLIFKPGEFIGRHKLLCSIIALAAIAGGVYWWYRVRENKPTLYREVTADYIAEQIRVMRQSGNTCGVHAAFNIVAWYQSGGDQAEFERLANDREQFEAFLDAAQNIAGPEQDVRLHGLIPQDVRRLVEEVGHVPNFSFVESPADFRKTLAYALPTRPLEPRSVFQVGNPQFARQLAQFRRSKKNGRLYFIINPAANPGDEDAAVIREDLLGHFVAVEVTHDQETGKPVFKVADSFGDNCGYMKPVISDIARIINE